MNTPPRAKAWLQSGRSERLYCQFNPTDLTITKMANWRAYPRPATNASSDDPAPQFTGTGSTKIAVNLLFEDFDHLDRPRTSVAEAVERILHWTKIPDPNAPATHDPDAHDPNHPQPPIVKFGWGRAVWTGVLTNVVAKYIRWSTDGVPLRATVNVTLLGVPDYIPGQNPTSGGVTGRRAATIVQGDSLQSIAFRYYRDPNLWRALAIANGIDDPTRLRIGTNVLIPTQTDAERLSANGREN